MPKVKKCCAASTLAPFYEPLRALLDRTGPTQNGQPYSLRAALDFLQHQREAQRHDRIGSIGGAGGGLGELLFNVAPRRSRPAILRQVPHQRAHVGEGLERHDRGDDQRLRQRARPVRTRSQAIAFAQSTV